MIYFLNTANHHAGRKGIADVMKKISRSDEAYLALKKKIANMDSGSHLSIRNFASEIGMSYTPVREAFLRLEQEGVLRQVPHVGFFVQGYDMPAIAHCYQVRECLEPFVLQNVFHLLTADDIQLMQEHLDAGTAAIREGSLSSFIDHDIAFHEVIFTRYGNPYLSSLYHSVREKNKYCSKGIQTVFSYATEDHTQLLNAIKAGNLGKSVEILSTHIKHAKANMLAGFVELLS